MADRPIPFTTPMVQALLTGRKTQTRRLASVEQLPTGLWHVKGRGGGAVGVAEADVPSVAVDYQNFEVGDRLWVKERHASFPPFGWRYPATDDVHELRRIIPPMFMKRVASRITLVVTEVRVERVQSITRDDAIAEGVQRVGGGVLRWENYSAAEGQSATTPQAAYGLLWNRIYEDRPALQWNANPWVVAVTFTVHPFNIDAPELAGALAPSRPATGVPHAG